MKEEIYIVQVLEDGTALVNGKKVEGLALAFQIDTHLQFYLRGGLAITCMMTDLLKAESMVRLEGLNIIEEDEIDG